MVVKKKVGFALAIVFLVAAISASAYTGWYAYLWVRFSMIFADYLAWGSTYYMVATIVGISCTIAFWILFGKFRKYNKYLKG